MKKITNLIIMASLLFSYSAHSFDVIGKDDLIHKKSGEANPKYLNLLKKHYKGDRKEINYDTLPGGDCISNYDFVPKLGVGVSFGAGFAGTLGILGAVMAGAALTNFIAVPVIAAAAITAPIMISYSASHDTLLVTAIAVSSGKVSKPFLEMLSDKDKRKGLDHIMKRQKRLFSKASMKKWCSHPMYDYLTLKRKIRKGQI
jgi:hypothetical protein